MPDALRRSGWIAIVLMTALAAGGCANKGRTKSDDPAASASNSSTNLGAASGSDAFGSGQTGADSQEDGPLLDTVYFEYDSSDIRADARTLLDRHAARLLANATLRMRLEGHADERGTREYNIGLGERRAQAVRRYLMLQGVRESQLATISYGEERPAVVGAGETSWSRNRRVELRPAG